MGEAKRKQAKCNRNLEAWGKTRPDKCELCDDGPCLIMGSVVKPGKGPDGSVTVETFGCLQNGRTALHIGTHDGSPVFIWQDVRTGKQDILIVGREDIVSFAKRIVSVMTDG